MATINDPENPFHGFEVVSTYTDRQAIEDGILVAISEKDRVSRAVWEYLSSHCPKGAQPPNRWPVDLMGWFRAEKISKVEALELIAKFGREESQKKFEEMVGDRKALAMSSALIRTHDRQARRIYDENLDGGIYKLYSMETPDGRRILSLAASAAEAEVEGSYKVLWLIPNENGGITLLFPEDY